MSDSLFKALFWGNSIMKALFWVLFWDSNFFEPFFEQHFMKVTLKSTILRTQKREFTFLSIFLSKILFWATQKSNLLFWALFWGLFWHFLELGPLVETWSDRPFYQKKWPWTSVGPVRVRITEKRPFVRWAEKGTNGQNSVFRYINTPKTVIPR